MNPRATLTLLRKYACPVETSIFGQRKSVKGTSTFNSLSSYYLRTAGFRLHLNWPCAQLFSGTPFFYKSNHRVRVSPPARGELPAMNQLSTKPPISEQPPSHRRSNRGFSVLELVTVVAVGLILAAISAPLIQSITRNMRLNAAVNSVTGAMQSTRYRAIYDGCPYTLTVSKDTDTYQLASEVTGGACAAAFTNVGTSIPFSNKSFVALDQNLVFQFSPGGSATVTTGTSTFNFSYVGYSAIKKQVQVTKYGSITVQ